MIVHPVPTETLWNMKSGDFKPRQNASYNQFKWEIWKLSCIDESLGFSAGIIGCGGAELGTWLYLMTRAYPVIMSRLPEAVDL